MKIAVLLTSFDRKHKTLNCLKGLQEQCLPVGVELKIFLTDDASTDGTAEAVKERFPNVTIISGTGDLYWAGGMRTAWRKALLCLPDYYFLLNDDTTLVPNAISILIETSLENGSERAVVIGSTCDDFGITTYGGWSIRSRFLVWIARRIHPHSESVDCDYGNGNILLVPQYCVRKIGILANHFTHSLADYDFTLRAKKAGFSLKLAPGYLGVCVNDHGKLWKSKNTSFSERMNHLKHPKGIAYKEHLRFIRDHFPLTYPWQFFNLWFKTLLPFARYFNR